MSTDSSQSVNVPEFGNRMREAFDNASNAEIARKLGITPTAVGNHIKGRVTLSVLIGVSTSTGCSVDWLLTGDGEKYVKKTSRATLDETFRNIIREIVRDEVNSSENYAEIRGENLKTEKEKEKTPSPA